MSKMSEICKRMRPYTSSLSAFNEALFSRTKISSLFPSVRHMLIHAVNGIELKDDPHFSNLLPTNLVAGPCEDSIKKDVQDIVQLVGNQIRDLSNVVAATEGYKVSIKNTDGKSVEPKSVANDDIEVALANFQFYVDLLCQLLCIDPDFVTPTARSALNESLEIFKQLIKTLVQMPPLPAEITQALAHNSQDLNGRIAVVEVVLNDSTLISLCLPGYEEAIRRILKANQGLNICLDNLDVLVLRPQLVNKLEYFECMIDAFPAVQRFVDIRVPETYFKIMKRCLAKLSNPDRNKALLYLYQNYGEKPNEGSLCLPAWSLKDKDSDSFSKLNSLMDDISRSTNDERRNDLINDVMNLVAWCAVLSTKVMLMTLLRQSVVLGGESVQFTVIKVFEQLPVLSRVKVKDPTATSADKSSFIPLLTGAMVALTTRDESANYPNNFSAFACALCSNIDIHTSDPLINIAEFLTKIMPKFSGENYIPLFQFITLMLTDDRLELEWNLSPVEVDMWNGLDVNPERQNYQIDACQLLAVITRLSNKLSTEVVVFWIKMAEHFERRMLKFPKDAIDWLKAMCSDVEATYQFHLTEIWNGFDGHWKPKIPKCVVFTMMDEKRQKYDEITCPSHDYAVCIVNTLMTLSNVPVEAQKYLMILAHDDFKQHLVKSLADVFPEYNKKLQSWINAWELMGYLVDADTYKKFSSNTIQELFNEVTDQCLQADRYFIVMEAVYQAIEKNGRDRVLVQQLADMCCELIMSKLKDDIPLESLDSRSFWDAFDKQLKELSALFINLAETRMVNPFPHLISVVIARSKDEGKPAQLTQPKVEENDKNIVEDWESDSNKHDKSGEKMQVAQELSCGFCKGFGHTKRSCPKKEELANKPACGPCPCCQLVNHNRYNCPKEKCFNCQKFGHVYSNCPFKGSDPYTLLPERSNAPPEIRDYAKKHVCMNCNEMGHTTPYCPKPEGYNRTCHNCQKTGHLTRYCSERAAVPIECHRCGEKGHISKNCNFKCPLCDGMGRCNRNCPNLLKNVQCYGCQQKGHREKDCPNRQKVENLPSAKPIASVEATEPDEKNVKETNESVVAESAVEKRESVVRKDEVVTSDGSMGSRDSQVDEVIDCSICSQSHSVKKKCPQCSRCRQYGHKALKCPTKEEVKDEGSDSESTVIVVDSPLVQSANTDAGLFIPPSFPVPLLPPAQYGSQPMPPIFSQPMPPISVNPRMAMINPSTGPSSRYKFPPYGAPPSHLFSMIHDEPKQTATGSIQTMEEESVKKVPQESIEMAVQESLVMAPEELLELDTSYAFIPTGMGGVGGVGRGKKTDSPPLSDDMPAPGASHTIVPIVPAGRGGGGLVSHNDIPTQRQTPSPGALTIGPSTTGRGASVVPKEDLPSKVGSGANEDFSGLLNVINAKGHNKQQQRESQGRDQAWKSNSSQSSFKSGEYDAHRKTERFNQKFSDSNQESRQSRQDSNQAGLQNREVTEKTEQSCGFCYMNGHDSLGHTKLHCPVKEKRANDRVRKSCNHCSSSTHNSYNCPNEPCFNCRKRFHTYFGCPDRDVESSDLPTNRPAVSNEKRYDPKRQHGNYNQTERQHGNYNQTERQHGNYNQTERQHGNYNQTERQHGNYNQTERQHGNYNQTERQHGNYNQTERQHGNYNQTERQQQHGNYNQTERQHGNYNQMEFTSHQYRNTPQGPYGSAGSYQKENSSRVYSHQSERRDQSQTACHKCGQEGHFQRDCQTRFPKFGSGWKK